MIPTASHHRSALARVSRLAGLRQTLRRRACWACLWIAMAVPGFAQTGTAAATDAPAPVVRLRLLAFQPGQATADSFLHDPAAPDATPGVKAPVKSYLNHESVTFAPRSRRLVLTTSPERASIHKPGDVLAEATLPDGVPSAIMLCLPASPGAKSPFRILVIDDSTKSFPPGSYRLTNLSPSKVKIELEKRPWVIEPGATELIVDPPVRHGELCGMKAFVSENGNWRRISSGIWPHPGQARVIQLLYFNPATRQVQLRAFDDVPPADPPPAAASPGD